MTSHTTSMVSSGKRQLLFAMILISVVTFAVYCLTLSNGFIDYDDTDYVTVNQVVRNGLSWHGLRWAFTAFHAGNWHPLTWLSHMVDIELFGLNPAGHHAVNLVLHTVNALLLFLLLYRWTGFVGRSLMVALFFAVHPLHVESVAWIAERKDVLSTLFWFLAMWAYTEYARHESHKLYLLVVVFFVLGLMAKQMLVTMPIIFLMMDFWPLKRCASEENISCEKMDLKRLIAEKIPLLAIAVAASLLTIRAQDTAGALNRGDGSSVLLSVGNACISYVAYIVKMFLPVNLSLFYPLDPASVTVTKVAGAIVLLTLITLLASKQRQTRPQVFFGWFWYLVTLLPVIGFIRIGSQAMADRYTYIPLTGLFLVVVWGAAEFVDSRPKLRLASVGAAITVVSSFAILSVIQIRYWRSSYDLYSHALAVTKNNWVAHNNMGILLSQYRRPEEALFHFQESVRINPNGAEGFKNLGNVYQMVGRNSEAIAAFREGVRIKPNDAEGHYRLGMAYLISGNAGLAYQEYQQLRRLDDKYAQPLWDAITMAGR